LIYNEIEIQKTLTLNKMIVSTKITLQPADIYDLHITPKAMVAAPPAGFTNTILAITHTMIFNSLAYATGGTFQYNVDPNNDVVFQDAITLSALYDVNIPVRKSNTANLPFVTTGALYLTTSATATVGNSPVDVYIIYAQNALS
jgi:hypothetical protein